ncbi:hypothetical protein KDX16_15935 [Burkholderia vietnamiensis]|uniref:Uncharacterized protein n=2 Tax=Burkholderiaceae TaxID=119060 RepID=A0A6P2LQ42_9BURK|nr:hypothetical protein [Burkholderia vietnamiensis]MBR7917314.1 hypothetical protein [Burkholderia vietnamiensis]MBR8055219.1 hypothetical protein [Burkholderia vietnamiensis]VWB72560.1 hypothetical protein BLA13014_03299 [Burkholderia aenigmatica]
MSMQITTNACPVQRWRLGRDYWRVDRDEGFRKQDYAVDLISDSVAKQFVVEHHYSASYPAAVERAGLFRGTELVGVCVFSVPMNNAAIPKYTGLAPSAGVDLGRFILLDNVPYNGETYFLKRAFVALQQSKPQIKGVIAYSDPVPRHTAAGRVVMPGHVGIIYQAGSARYVGRSASRVLHLSASGHVLSPPRDLEDSPSGARRPGSGKESGAAWCSGATIRTGAGGMDRRGPIQWGIRSRQAPWQPLLRFQYRSARGEATA